MRQKIEGAGVLDVKWGNQENLKTVLVTWANSNGTINFGSFDGNQIHLNGSSILDGSSITMSCAISPINQKLISGSLSSGKLGVFDIDKPTEVSLLPGHDLEAWTVSFDNHNPDLLHSGGDDAKWKQWDLRGNISTFANRYHSAGVCSILPHPIDQNLIITGSYDKQGALWDRRNQKSPLKTVRVGSGVWKLKWDLRGELKTLSACMYDGFYIFDWSDQNVDDIIISKYDPNALCYGCDWLDDSTAITCSFYNRQIQIWNEAL